MNEDAIKHRRDPGIELFRCVLMFLIIFGHCCLFGNGGDKQVAKALSIPGMFATDAFILISGWFGIRFTVRKIIAFLAIGLFSSCCLLCVQHLLKISAPFCLTLGWFGNSYLGLMFLAPLINAAVEKLSGVGLLVRTWGLYALMMLIAWLPVKGLDLVPTGWCGLSFNTLLFVYVTGRVMRENIERMEFGMKRLIVVFCLLMVANLAWSAAAAMSSSQLARSVFVGSKDYNSPIILGLAVCSFLIFKKLKVCHWLAATVCFCTPSMFGIYLLSVGSNGRVSQFLYRHYAFLDLGTGACFVFLKILVASVMVYGVSLAVDLVRRFLLWSAGHLSGGKQ